MKLQPNTSRRDGFTIIEMLIATMMLLVLSFLITNMIISGNQTQKFADRLGRATEITQEVLDDVQRELQGAVRVFENSILGNAYVARVAPWPGADPIASTRLPTIRPTGTFKRDVAGTESTGNSVFFVRHAWADSFQCTSGRTHRLDVYRMVRYYLKPEAGGPRKGKPYGLNLVKWTSEPMVNGTQLDAIADATDRTEIAVHLFSATPDVNNVTHVPLNLVLKLGEDPAVAGTFRQILQDGSLVSAPVAPRAKVWQIEREESMSNAGLLFYRHHSVASNYAKVSKGVVRFGIRNDQTNSIGFPHGLEVQCIGSAAARKVLVHMTTVSTNENGMRAFYDGQIVFVVREG